jgi:putative restriction endonuclease
MTTTPPQVAIRLRKAATDAGFDLESPPVGNWLCFGTTRSPVRIWLTAYGETVFVAAISQHKVAEALAAHGVAHLSPLPDGAAGGRCVTSIDALGALLYRVIPLARTLPYELLHVFQAKTVTLPRTTEAERLVVQRVGQDVFRAGLLEYWQGRCAVTGLAVPALLRASHIKPWADCGTDAERLDVFNGLLLAPHLDAAFDGGWITFDDDGAMRVSTRLDDRALAILGLGKPLRLVGLLPRHGAYLAWHRVEVFE